MKKVGKVGSVFVWRSGHLIPVKGQFLKRAQSKKTKLPVAAKSIVNESKSSTADEGQDSTAAVGGGRTNSETKDGAN